MSIFNSFAIQTASTVNNGFESSGLESLLFPVASVPLFWRNTGVDGLVPDELIEAGYTGVLDVNRNTILYAGRDYSIVKNEEIVKALQPAFEAGYRLVRVRNFNNTRFQIDLENKSVSSMIKVGDRELPVTGRVRINNSYDGSLAFSLQMGYWVEICGNGAIAGDILAYKRKHNKNNECVEHIEQGLAALTNETLGKSITKLNKLWLITDEATVKGMFRRIVEGIPDPKDGTHPVKVQLLSRLSQEYATYQNDVFALYMAVTNMTTYPAQYGLAASYLQRLEANSAKVFA